MVLQKAYYFTGTDGYPGWTDKFFKAKPALSTTEKRGKRKQQKNQKQNKKKKQPSYAHNCNDPENFWDLRKPIPDTDLQSEKCFLKVA